MPPLPCLGVQNAPTVRFRSLPLSWLAASPQRLWRCLSSIASTQESIDRHAKRGGQTVHHVNRWVHNPALDTAEIRPRHTSIERQLLLRQPASRAQPPHIPRQPCPSIHGGKARGLRALIHDVYDRNYVAAHPGLKGGSPARLTGRRS